MTSDAKLPEVELPPEVKEQLLKDAAAHGVSFTLLKNDGTVERINPADVYEIVERQETR